MAMKQGLRCLQVEACYHQRERVAGGVQRMLQGVTLGVAGVAVGQCGKNVHSSTHHFCRALFATSSA